MNYDELKAALLQLPTEPDAPNRVPQPLSFHLSQRKRVARQRLNLPWIEYRLLAGLALSGWSLRYGLIQAEAAMQGHHPRNGTFIRAGAHLEKAGLWQVMTVRLNASVSLVQLTPLGRQLLTEISVTPVRSEWEELQPTQSCWTAVASGRRQCRRSSLPTLWAAKPACTRHSTSS